MLGVLSVAWRGVCVRADASPAIRSSFVPFLVSRAPATHERVRAARLKVRRRAYRRQRAYDWHSVVASRQMQTRSPQLCLGCLLVAWTSASLVGANVERRKSPPLSSLRNGEGSGAAAWTASAVFPVCRHRDSGIDAARNDDFSARSVSRADIRR